MLGHTAQCILLGTWSLIKGETLREALQNRSIKTKTWKKLEYGTRSRKIINKIDLKEDHQQLSLTQVIESGIKMMMKALVSQTRPESTLKDKIARGQTAQESSKFHRPPKIIIKKTLCLKNLDNNLLCLAKKINFMSSLMAKHRKLIQLYKTRNSPQPTFV